MAVENILRQWFKSAGLDVNIDFAWGVNRMRLGCKQCHTVEVMPVPVDSHEIRWELQDYVRRHRPGGPHNIDETQLDLNAEKKKLAEAVASWSQPMPLTTGKGTPTQITWNPTNWSTSAAPLPSQKVQLAPVPLTADFKPVPLKPKTARITQGRRFR